MAGHEELLHLRYNQRHEDLIEVCLFVCFLMPLPKVGRDTGQQLAFRLIQQFGGRYAVTNQDIKVSE